MCIHIFILAFGLFGPFSQPSETGVVFAQNNTNEGDRWYFVFKRGFLELVGFTTILLGGIQLTLTDTI